MITYANKRFGYIQNFGQQAFWQALNAQKMLQSTFCI
jgi:hypothetical protein